MTEKRKPDEVFDLAALKRATALLDANKVPRPFYVHGPDGLIWVIL